MHDVRKPAKCCNLAVTKGQNNGMFFELYVDCLHTERFLLTCRISLSVRVCVRVIQNGSAGGTAGAL